MTDNELCEKLKKGNIGAFNELVARYKTRVINTCYRFMLNREDAEDLAQEVFISAFQSIHSFRQDAQLSTWIYRIAVSKSLDEIKKRNRKKRISAVGRMLKLEDVISYLAGGSKPDKQLESSEKMVAIMAALNMLPDNQRVAFTLSKIDGYSNPEIAAIMGTTTDAVESLIKRAKQKLQADLEQRLRGY